IPAIGIGTLVGMVLGAVAGRALRNWVARRSFLMPYESEPSVAQEGYLQVAMLGTLGLLLAFSFGMVLNRYETRRELVVQEANAIGTAYLRSQLLDDPYGARLSKLLVRYTANRIKLASTPGDTSTYLATNDRLLIEVWATVK